MIFSHLLVQPKGKQKPSHRVVGCFARGDTEHWSTIGFAYQRKDGSFAVRVEILPPRGWILLTPVTEDEVTGGAP
jgi:hypothetical protein